MGFEVFQKTSAPLAKVPSVTLQKSGVLSFNRAAMALIGSPGQVELLWDAKRRIIGLRATPEENPNAYPARAQSTKNDKGPILVAAATFANFYKLDLSVSKRWTPYVEDEVLCIDLSTPGQPVTSNRSPRPAAEQGDMTSLEAVDS